MKRFYIKFLSRIALLSFVVTVGCTKVLEEKPRAIFTPEYFQSEKGVMGGLTSLYAHLRWIYGHGYYYSGIQSGTDESTWGQNVNADSRNADFSGVGAITPTQNPYGVIWGTFSNINTASGIIENAEAVGTISDALIAEARFFRAFDYFLLVQTFGGVPLDLGAGELKFNTSTSRTSARNTVPEVYTKAIFPDLVQAVNDLPVSPRMTGTLTKTVARLYLAKAYLTYGWWLENPENIPTYPEAARVDPDGRNAQWYFQEAYNVAVEAIDNPGPYALQPYFYDVNLGSNDRNSEMMLYADHTEKSDLFNGDNVTGWGSGNSPGSFAPWFPTWNYGDLRSSTSASSFVAIGSVQREAVQALGRPWTAVAPTHELLFNVFADKTNDSRYDGSFTTVYRGNWHKNPNDAHNAVVYNANNLPVGPNEPILTILDEDPGNITYPDGAGASNVGAGEMPGRADWVLAPQRISRYIYPNLWKLGPYRTDSGNGLGEMNVTYTRPFPVAKFSEFYLVAAEAAVKGASTVGGKSARDLVNVLRERAGKWRWHNNNAVEKNEDHSAAMVAATPATITIDYILDERSREYYGECFRWFDLVRTQTWHIRAAAYTITGTAKGASNPETFTRNIQPKDYLRPIPQGQLDGMEMTAEEKQAYQNPGYN